MRLRTKILMPFVALLFSTATHADCYHTEIPPVPSGDYSYVNAYYEWETPSGVDMEQFFYDIGGPVPAVTLWEYGPVSDFPPMTVLAPNQFPADATQSAPEPTTYGLLLAGILTLVALKWFIHSPGLIKLD